jgi:hypothetical protein
MVNKKQAGKYAYQPVFIATKNGGIVTGMKGVVVY